MSEQEIPQPKRIGRPPGAKTKNTLLLEQAQKLIEEKFGIKDFHPVIYMMTVAADEDKDENLRMTAAKAAAPYITPTLKAVELTGEDGGPVQLDLSAARDRLRRAFGITKEEYEAEDPLTFRP